MNKAEEIQMKNAELMTEMQKDYEQVDAERMGLYFCISLFVLSLYYPLFVILLFVIVIVFVFCLVYGQETMQMRYSEHPQYAENIEDMTAARQSFSDFVMLPFNNNQLKHERLATMQDENRRKIFLERFEVGSKMLNGLASDEQVSGGYH